MEGRVGTAHALLTGSRDDVMKSYLVPPILALFFAACSSDTAPPQPDAVNAADSRPTRREDTLVVEGRQVIVPLVLVQSPPTFPMQFTTYAPAAAGVQFAVDSSGASVSFNMPAGDSIQPESYAHVRFMTADQGSERAESIITAYLEGRNAHAENLATRGDWPWALEAYRFQYRGPGNRIFTGSAAVAERDGVPFYLLLHHPADSSDDHASTLMTTLEHWRWTSTDDPLMK
jgi:hypothetical protein